jgi:small GTP-binding protein
MRNGNVLAINIFDLSGDDDYQLIRKDFMSDALGVLLVYDINIKSTFENIVKWEREAESNGINLSKCVVVLIGNKIDIKNRREVNQNTAKDFAKSRGYQYYEASAKTGQGINETFENLFDSLHSRAIEIRSRYFY